MGWLELLGAIVGTGGVAGVVGALIGRPKVRAEAQKISADAAASIAQTAADTVEGLLGSLRQEIAALAAELSMARQTIATQQQTISEQQRTIGLHLTARTESDRRVRDLEIHVVRLEALVRALGGDPDELLRQAGHPPAAGRDPEHLTRGRSA